MNDDTSDILGGPTLPNMRGDQFPRFSGLSFLVAVPALLFSYVIVTQVWERFLIWREKSYKL